MEFEIRIDADKPTNSPKIDTLHGPGVSGESRPDHDLDYWASRMFKFEKQHQPVQSTLFQHLSFYITGRTQTSLQTRTEKMAQNDKTDNLSHFHIVKLIESNGGKIVWFFQRKSVTHIICQNLAAGKAHQEFFNRNSAPSLNPVHVIKPQWVFDCIKAQKRLDVHPYLVYKPQQKSLDFYFSYFSSTPKPEDLGISQDRLVLMRLRQAKNRLKKIEAIRTRAASIKRNILELSKLDPP